MKRILLASLFIISLSFENFAQNTGPAAPEAMGFEPIDASNMVNMLTGDFTYPIPIINVPSPEGGYAMNLSYKAGISVNTEANWVGLGWSLTPGAINRSVNNIPDDLKNGIWCYNYFKILDETSYNFFHIEATFFGAYAGISATWGDYNTVTLSGGYGSSEGLSVGGSVTVGDTWGMSVGGQMGNIGIGGYVGENGYGIYASLSYSESIGKSSFSGSASFGLSIGNEGIGFSVNSSMGYKNNITSANLSSMGINFSSSGTSISVVGNVNNSNSNSFISSNYVSQNKKTDYKLYTPWLYWGSTNITTWISVDKTTTKYGVMYLNEGIKDSKDNGYYVALEGFNRRKMDIPQHDYYGVQTSINTIDVMDISNNFYEDNKLKIEGYQLPAYDLYIMSGQGNSGSISPMIFQDYQETGNSRTPLALPGNYSVLSDYGTTCDDDGTPCLYYKKVKEQLIYFDQGTDFEKINKSNSNFRFLTEYSNNGRLEATEGSFLYDASLNKTDPYDLWGNFKFVGGTLTDGEGNITSAKKTNDANYVEWFTNKEIAENGSDLKRRGFIETESIKEFDDKNLFGHPRLDTRYFDPDGIGAITVTSLDGKRYHYSLPVYQYEVMNRLYEEGTEVMSEWDMNKYAYYWCLTAITGPDYYDKNNNGKVDQKDYGYWVKFEYSKWTDTYFWSFPYFANELDVKDYSGSRVSGRKQLVYLDAIVTRTHTALFIKDVKDDGKGMLSYFSYKGSPKNLSMCGRYDLNFLDILPDPFTTDEGTTYHKSELKYWLTQSWQYEGYRYTPENISLAIRPYVNYNITPTLTMKLSKILLLSNEDCPTIDSLKTKKYIPRDCDDVIIKYEFRLSKAGPNENGDKPNFYRREYYEDFNITYNIDADYFPNINSNTLVNYPQLEEKAIESIDFLHDYNLSGINGSTNGRLTLNGLQKYGQKKQQFIPPYLFTYAKNPVADTAFKDDWGFYIDESIKDNYKEDGVIQDKSEKSNADAWSMTQITNPIGGKININYESDVYEREAATDRWGNYCEVEKYIFPNIDYKTIDVKFKTTVDIETSFILNNTYELLDNNDALFTAMAYLDSNVVRFKLADKKDFYDIIALGVKVGLDVCNLGFGLRHNEIDSLGYCVCENPAFRFDTYEMYDSELSKTYLMFEDGSACNQCFSSMVSVITLDKIPNEYKFFLGENVNNSFYGGGLRVASISVENEGGIVNKTAYSYEGGITSYSPEDVDKRHIAYMSILPSPQVMYKTCMVSNYDNTDKLMNKSEYFFNVLEPINSAFSKTISLGNTYLISENIDKTYSYTNKYGDQETKLINAKITDNLSSIGRLEKQISYNEAGQIISQTEYIYNEEYKRGNRQETFINPKMYIHWDDGLAGYDRKMLLSSVTKQQKVDVLGKIKTKNKFGVIEENYENIDEKTGTYLDVITENYDGTIYKSVSIPAYSINNYHGAITDDQSNVGMGSKVDNIYNKNMLTQQAASISYKKVGEDWKPLSASIQTWKGDWNNYVEWNPFTSAYTYNNIDELSDGTDVNIWRKHKTFVWRGELDANGYYANFNNYDTPDKLTTNFPGWANANYSGTSGSANGWKQTSEIVRYNHYSSPVEVTDINGDYAASKMDPYHVYTTVSAANASYSSFAATSFEFQKNYVESCYLFEGEVISMQASPTRQSYNNKNQSDDMITGIEAHTGESYGYITPGATNGCRYIGVKNDYTVLTAGDYRAAIWVHKNSPGTLVLKATVGETVTSDKNYVGQFGDWRLFYLDFNVPSTVTSFRVSVDATNGAVYVDDFRVAPFQSAVTSYTYDNAGLVTAIINNDNFATKYEYDKAGRLIATYRETEKGFEIVSSNQYHYKDYFDVSPNRLGLLPAEGKSSIRFDVSVSNEESWTVSIPDWCSVNCYSRYFLLSVTENLNYNTRCGEIDITSTSGKTIEIRIQQNFPKKIVVNSPVEGAKYYYNDNMPINWNEYNMGSGVTIYLYGYDRNDEFATGYNLIKIRDYQYQGGSGNHEISYKIPQTIDNYPTPWSAYSYYKIVIVANNNEKVVGESGFFNIYLSR